MKYRGFLSYSRADDKIADWLHRRLDSYRTPRALVGSEGALGAVPDRLYPIFRDRSDLPGGGKLNERLNAALEQSQALIVLCSPDAAASSAVNDEILMFQKLGRADRIFPVIAYGLPDAQNFEQEFFPPALRGSGLLAADLREISLPAGRMVGDGREAGRLKLIAGLLGVPLDALMRRERRRQRFINGVLSLSAVTFAAVAVAAVSGFLLANHQRQKAEQNLAVALEGVDALVSEFANEVKYFKGVHFSVVGGIIEKAEAIALKLDASGSDPRILYRLGKTRSAIGQVQQRIGKPDDARLNHENAIEILQEILKANPDQGEIKRDLLQAHLRLGALYKEASEAVKASNQYNQALALAPASPAMGHDPDPLMLDTQYLTGLVEMHLGDIAALGSAGPEYPSGHIAATRYYESAIERFDGVKASHPTPYKVAIDEAHAKLALGDIYYYYQRDNESALSLYNEAFLALEESLLDTPSNIEGEEISAKVLERLADLALDAEAAEQYLDRAALKLEGIVQSNPEDLSLREAMGYHLWHSATIFLRWERHDKARVKYHEAAKVFGSLIDEGGMPQGWEVEMFLETSAQAGVLASNLGDAEFAASRWREAFLVAEAWAACRDLTTDDVLNDSFQDSRLDSEALTMHILEAGRQAQEARLATSASQGRKSSIEAHCGVAPEDWIP